MHMEFLFTCLWFKEHFHFNPNRVEVKPRFFFFFWTTKKFWKYGFWGHIIQILKSDGDFKVALVLGSKWDQRFQNVCHKAPPTDRQNVCRISSVLSYLFYFRFWTISQIYIRPCARCMALLIRGDFYYFCITLSTSKYICDILYMY